MIKKIKIFEIFFVLIAIFLLIGAVQAADDNIGDDTVKISESENTVELESADNDQINPVESSQDPVISQTNDNALSDSTANNATQKQGVITSSNLKTEYLSGKSMKTTIIDKNTGKGIETILKVQYIKNNKIIQEEFYCTDSDGVNYITPTVPVGTYAVKISVDDNEKNVTAQTITQKVTIVKTTTKLTAKKVTAYKGYKVTLKAVLSKTKMNSKINEGKVKFKINGKTYLVKVKNGVASKNIKLNKVKTYKYTAQYIGTSNIQKTKIVTGKVIVKNRLATKITVKSLKGYSGEKMKYQILITTASGKKVTSGQLKITWNGKKLVCNVTNGVVKLVGTFGGNYKNTVNGNQYFYKQFTTNFKAKYIPTSLKYKESSAKYSMISTYKCESCNKTVSHTHKTNQTITKIILV